MRRSRDKHLLVSRIIDKLAFQADWNGQIGSRCSKILRSRMICCWGRQLEMMLWKTKILLLQIVVGGLTNSNFCCPSDSLRSCFYEFHPHAIVLLVLIWTNVDEIWDFQWGRRFSFKRSLGGPFFHTISPLSFLILSDFLWLLKTFGRHVLKLIKFTRAERANIKHRVLGAFLVTM